MYNNLISRHQIRYGNPVGLVEMIESAGIARDQVTLAAPLQVFLPEPEAVPRESREAAEEFKKVFATLQRAKKPPAKTLTERENDLADQAKFLISREDVKN
jgi:succinylglutamate desuccinylase